MARPGEARRWTGRKMLYLMLGFFGLVITVNGVMVFLALDTFTGLTNPNAYVDGLNYNERLAQAREREALGWRGDVAVAPDAAGGHAVTLRLDRAEGPISGARVSLIARRPTQDGLDQRVALLETAPGVYAGRLTVPLPGQWDLLVAAERDGAIGYRAVERVTLRTDG